MLYIALLLVLMLFVLGILIWLRKIQFDAVHRNFLDLVDHYGGRVIRDGFAIRPKFSGFVDDRRISISISSERKTNKNPRRFYISIYLQAPAKINFTIMSNAWINLRQENKGSKRIIKQIMDKQYSIEVSSRNLLKNLDVFQIEKVVNQMHPFAYVLVSRKGLILERLSDNLIADTEYEKLNPLLKALQSLTSLPLKGEVS